jgi:hypothetical protein
VPDEAVVVWLNMDVRILLGLLYCHRALGKRHFERMLEIALSISNILRAFITRLANLKQTPKLPSWLKLLAPHSFCPHLLTPGLLPLVWPSPLAWIRPSVLFAAVLLYAS